METIEIKSMTSIEDAVKLVLHTAKLSRSRVVSEFNGFILDSNNSYAKNIDLFWAYMGRADRNVNWEQRRYEIAKAMLPAIYADDGNASTPYQQGHVPLPSHPRTLEPVNKRQELQHLLRHGQVGTCPHLLTLLSRRTCRAWTRL